MFATWDAEEWGLVGSTEYVEDDSLRLLRGAVAYLNQDVARRQGPNFGGGGSPSLRATLRSIARAVDDPSGKGSVYDVWRRASSVADSSGAGHGRSGRRLGLRRLLQPPRYSALRLGIRRRGGVYHSAYDSRHWMETFGDPGYRYHAAAARIGAAHDAAARERRRAAVRLRRVRAHHAPLRPGGRSGDRGAEVAHVVGRALGVDRSAWSGARRRSARRATPRSPRRCRRRRARATNAALLRVERALTRPEGLRTRPWYRNLIYAADENNGYANIVFPSVNEAIRAGDATLAQREIDDLARRFDAAAAALDDAGRALDDVRAAAPT